jgi:hypothetical protein
VEAIVGPSRNPYHFIVGCQRSGTTLLGRMVDANPHVAIIHETRWIASWFEDRGGLTPEGYVTRELIPLLLDHPRFAKLQIDREDLEGLLVTGDPVLYRDFITGIFDLYGNKHGKDLVGDKSPRYVRFILTLHQLWPHAKFAHILRDGRDVWLPATDWRSGGELRRRIIPLHEYPVTTTAVWWDWRVRTGREDGNALGPDLYYEVCYESLVSKPTEECEKLCGFLGIPYDEAMLRSHEGRERPKPDRSVKRAWLGVTSGLRDWRSEMSAEDVERFEAAAGDLLEELGYPRGASYPNLEASRTASLVRTLFNQELLAGGDWPPGSGNR